MISADELKRNSLLKRMDIRNGIAEVRTYSQKVQPIHYHDNLELILVVRGKIRVKISCSELILERSEICWINAYDIHSVDCIDEDSEYISIHLKFGEDYLNDSLFLLESDKLKEDFDVYESIRNGIINIIEINSTVPLDRKRLNDAVNDMIAMLELNIKLVMYNISGDKNGYANNKLYIDRLNDILNYLYVHYDERLTLEDAAKLCGISKYHFSHTLKKCLNKSYKELMNVIRTDRAEALILGTDLSMEEICYRTGFSSYNYFSKAFKEVFLTTPMRYRIENKNNTLGYRYMDDGSEKVDLNLIKEFMRPEPPSEYIKQLHITVELPDEACQVYEIKEYSDEEHMSYMVHNTMEKDEIYMKYDCDEINIRIRRNKQQ